MKNKKILLAVLMIIMMVAVFSVNAFAANSQSIRGDLDGNDEINVDDAVYIRPIPGLLDGGAENV